MPGLKKESAQERFDRLRAEAKAKRAKKKLKDKAKGGFDSSGEMPISGERGGTEGPGLGSNQAPRQGRSNTSGVRSNTGRRRTRN